MKFLVVFGLIAGLCTSSSLIPQLVVTIKKKKAEDVSVFMFIVMLTGNSMWIYYGIAKKDISIIATNILALSLNIALVVLQIKYRDNR